jgi:hypothetical protein
VDIGVDKHEIVRIRLLHEAPHGHVAGPVHKTLILRRVEQELNLFAHQQKLEPKDTGYIGLEAQSAVARGAQEQFDHFI